MVNGGNIKNVMEKKGRGHFFFFFFCKKRDRGEKERREGDQLRFGAFIILCV